MPTPTLSDLRTALASLHADRKAIEETRPDVYENGSQFYLLLIAEANCLLKLARRLGGASTIDHDFVNRVRSLYNIDADLLPELRPEDWHEFRHNPPRYLINAADKTQSDAILREVEKRQL